MKDESPVPSAPLDLRPEDRADQLERLPLEEAQELLKSLPPGDVGPILLELPVETAVQLLEPVPLPQIIVWAQALPPNVIADLANAFPAPRRKDLLAGLPPDQASAVAALLRYPSDSAGGIMDNRFIAVRANQSAESCLAELRTSPRQRSDGVLYIYVTDDAGKLVGVVSLRDLVFAPAGHRITDIMNREVRFLRVTDDQEEIARRIQHYHFLGLPVVDENERLVGVVKVRDAIRLAETEATEDMQLMVGLSGEERLWTPWKQSVQRRLPWLGVNLLTALGAATVVGIFEDTLARWTALMMFLPLISAVAGNTGNQALTVIIRALALGEVAAGDALRVLRKEMAIGMANGLMLGSAIGLLAFGWKGSLMLGAVTGVAMWLNQIVGALAGVAVPFGLRRFGVDPALASSIFVTTITDVIGFLLFLGLATAALRFSGI